MRRNMKNVHIPWKVTHIDPVAIFKTTTATSSSSSSGKGVIPSWRRSVIHSQCPPIKFLPIIMNFYLDNLAQFYEINITKLI